MGLLNKLAKEQSGKSSGTNKSALSEIKQTYSDNKKLVRTSSNNTN